MQLQEAVLQGPLWRVYLRVRVGSEVSVEEAAAAVQQELEFTCIGDVAIVHQVHSQRAVHKEGVSLLH